MPHKKGQSRDGSAKKKGKNKSKAGSSSEQSLAPVACEASPPEPRQGEPPAPAPAAAPPLPFIWWRDFTLCRPTSAHIRGEFSSHFELARFYWTRVVTGWRIDEQVMTLPLLKLNLHVCSGRERRFYRGEPGKPRGEYCVGDFGPRIGCTGWEWDAPHLEGALMPVRSYFNLVSRQPAKWPRPPPGFTGPLKRLPRSGAVVSLRVAPPTLCPECEGTQAPWVAVSIQAFSVENHELFSGEWDDRWEDEWEWDGLPAGRAERAAEKEERAGFAAQRLYLALEAGDCDLEEVQDPWGWNEWIDQVPDDML